MLNKLFLKNDTVIIKFNIPYVCAIYSKPNAIDGFQYKKCSMRDADEIVDFYKSNRYDCFTKSNEVICEFKKGNNFHAIYHCDVIVAGLWIHQGFVNIPAPSFEALKLKHSDLVKFSDGVVYSSHNLVDVEFRGQHLYSMLLLNTLSDYKQKRTYIFITGRNNYKMIESSIKYMGQIVGYVRTIRICKYLWIRKRLISLGGGYWESISPK